MSNWIAEAVPRDLKAAAGLERGIRKGLLHLQIVSQHYHTPDAKGKRAMLSELRDFFPHVEGVKITTKILSGSQKFIFMLGYVQKDRGS